MEIPDRNKTESQDLFERVRDKVNADSIKAVLSKAKDDIPGDFGISGNSEELLGHLRDAVNAGSLTTEQVYALLQEGEENGCRQFCTMLPSRKKPVSFALILLKWRSDCSGRTGAHRQDFHYCPV